jgi:NDP-sugar pyrophosphorylase family protein
MKAMILAAGFGTRLKPLTNELPKALIVYKNKTLLEYQIGKLKSAGIDSIIINAHHLSEKLENYVNENDFGLKAIIIIKEKNILGTGGGILNAKDYLINEDFFIVVNVDVYANFDYGNILSFHKKNTAFSTLLIQKRTSKKLLEFDGNLKLIGRENSGSDKNNLFAFNGVHVISKKIFLKNLHVKYCDIIELYLQMVKDGETVQGYDAGTSYCKDLGKIENLRD